MTCVYCGDGTKNLNHVCDACEREAQSLADRVRQGCKEVIEVCPVCGEVIDMWLPEKKTSITCPFCGLEGMYLCNECQEKSGTCDKNNPKCYCYGNTDMFGF